MAVLLKSAALGFAALLFAHAATAQAPLDAAKPAGKAAAVSTDTQAAAPGRALTALNVADSVFEQGRIAAGPAGPAQVLFLDGSSVTVGANGQLTVDAFVYNPDGGGGGKMAASLSSGVMRFVGGRVSKDGSVEIRTPTATVGIRGGVAVVAYDPTSGRTQAVKHFGAEMRVTGPDGLMRSVTSNGFGVVADRASTGAPTKVTAEQAAALSGALQQRATPQPASVSDSQTDRVSAVNSVQTRREAALRNPLLSRDTTDESKIVSNAAQTIESLEGSKLPALDADLVAFRTNAAPYSLATSFNLGVTKVFYDRFGRVAYVVGTDGVINRGSAKVSETGGNEFIQWARWSDGVVYGAGVVPTIDLAGTGGMFSVWGVRSGATLPSSGSPTYSLYGATSAHSGDGTLKGTFNGTITPTFAGSSYSIAVNASIAMTNGDSYSMVGTIPGTVATGWTQTDVPTTGSGQACGGVCSGAATRTRGFFAGPGGQYAGMSYRVIGSTVYNSVYGAAAFKK